MTEMLIYRCPICGNVICMMEASGVEPFCCGFEMDRMSANTSDGVQEKHVPVIRREGTRVEIRVGEIEHPMLPAHHIQWICVLTGEYAYFRRLTSDDRPLAVFHIPEDEKIQSVYEMCNLHGLWRKDA